MTNLNIAFMKQRGTKKKHFCESFMLCLCCVNCAHNQLLCSDSLCVISCVGVCVCIFMFLCGCAWWMTVCACMYCEPREQIMWLLGRRKQLGK